MLEVSSLRLRSPPTPPSPGNSGSIKAAAATDPPPHQLIGFVGGDHVHAAAGFPTSPAADGFMDDVDTDSLLLDYIDFSSCDVVVPFFDADGDVLPDLEADPTELLAEFSSSCPHGHQAHQGYDDDDDDDDPAAAATVVSPADDACCRPARCLIIGGDNDQAKPPSPPPDLDLDLDPDVSTTEDVVVAVAVAVEDKKATDEEKRWLLDLGAAADHNNKQKDKEGLELEPAGGGSTKATTTSNPQEEDYSAPARAGAGADASKSSSSSASAGQRYHQTHSKKKPPAASNASNNKRKVKVDWTPDLHRRFVQAVEQLGIDKAVPSRILEIMGIQGLTRHNIASHLQKYRSHRKHLMAREAEAASWAHKRQMYAAAAAGGTAAPPTMVMNHSKQQQSSAAAAAAAGPRPWVVPTIGFPPPPPAPFCRSLHVWGHPPAVSSTAAVEAPTMLLPLPAVWPRRPTWPVDPAAYWHQQYSAARKWGPPPQPAAGTPCVPPPMPMQLPRFPAVPHPVPTMYSRQPMAPPPPPPPLPPSSKPAELQLQLDAHPSKESIDAAIGDVLVKPWLPLPLGLKPPSLDSVMSELHRHGIPKVPPAAKEHC